MERKKGHLKEERKKGSDICNKRKSGDELTNGEFVKNDHFN